MTRQKLLKGSGVLTAFAAGAIFLGWFTATPRSADAYTISTIITAGCREKVTTETLRAVRLDPATAATAAPLPADRNDRALIDDLEFTPADDMTDLGGATLLVGVRDNDLKGRDSMDLSQLPLVHGDPSAQREHCLRGAQEQEPGGSAAAVLDCRAFILERVGQALDGLDATGTPDVTNKTSLPLYLSLRHGVNTLLPTYYVRIGQAIHAVEDSFTHTYRTPDGMQITVVLDWVDEANGKLVEATDGPPHSTEMDRCDDPDDLRAQRRCYCSTRTVTCELRSACRRTKRGFSRSMPPDNNGWWRKALPVRPRPSVCGRRRRSDVAIAGMATRAAGAGAIWDRRSAMRERRIRRRRRDRARASRN